MDADLIRSELKEMGWATFREECLAIEQLEQAVLTIANSLGEPRATRERGRLIDVLLPTNALAAKPRSLSARYGLEQFPWHTDGAHWLTPPRYLVMACMNAHQEAAETLLCDGHSCAPLNSRAARTSVFRVANGSKSFYASPRGRLGQYYRYDPGCMTPMDDVAEEINEFMQLHQSERTHRIRWEAGTVLVVDNWRFLHRRTAAPETLERTLLRATVMEVE